MRVVVAIIIFYLYLSTFSCDLSLRNNGGENLIGLFRRVVNNVKAMYRVYLVVHGVLYLGILTKDE